MKSKTLSLKTIIKKLEFLQKADLINETFEEIEILLLANKLIEKIPDADNVKEHYQSFIRKKNRKSVKKSEIITYQPKTFDTVDIKSVITEYPKTSHKLSKTIRQAEKLGFNSSLYSDTGKIKNF